MVFGGLVTSPLYVYPSMNLKAPTVEDYLSIYCIIFWTLTLIGVVKYVGIALNADDQGEGFLILFFSMLEEVFWLIFSVVFQVFPSICPAGCAVDQLRNA